MGRRASRRSRPSSAATVSLWIGSKPSALKSRKWSEPSLLRRRDAPQLVEEVEDQHDVVLFGAGLRPAHRNGYPLSIGMQIEITTRRARPRRELCVGPDPRLVRTKRVALHRVVRHHHAHILARYEEQLMDGPRPCRVVCGAGRDLPFAAGTRKRPHVDLVLAGLVGDV